MSIKYTTILGWNKMSFFPLFFLQSCNIPISIFPKQMLYVPFTTLQISVECQDKLKEFKEQEMVIEVQTHD